MISYSIIVPRPTWSVWSKALERGATLLLGLYFLGRHFDKNRKGHAVKNGEILELRNLASLAGSNVEHWSLISPHHSLWLVWHAI